MFKYFNKRKKKGQSTLEYAILIIIILGALLSIQNYIKRGIQGRLQQATDDIGDRFSVGNMNYTKTVHVVSNTSEIGQQTGTESKLLSAETTTTNIVSNVLNVEAEYWGNAH